MKKIILSVGIAGCFLAGLALQSTHCLLFSQAEESVRDGFFTQTAVGSAYGDKLSAPAYQGEGGRYLLWEQGAQEGEMHRTGAAWASDEGEDCATVSDGYKYTPKERSVVWEWRALYGGIACFSGMIYNYYAFSSADDLTAYGVAPRAAAGGGDTRDGVTVSVVYEPRSGEEKVLYQNELGSDFCMFADEASYRVAEGDKIRILIDGGTDKQYDTVCLYMGVTLDEQVVAYDFTKQADYADKFVTDLTGKGNDLFVKDEFESPEADAEKGLRLDGNSEHFLYDLNHTSRDFTDYLTDFSVRVTYTIGSGNNDWKYIFSTTSHEGDMSTRGIALGLNLIGESDGKKKYALQIRADEEGDPGFFNATNGWTNDLIEGETYETVINVSTTERKIETFTTGTYNGNWLGTNASGSSAMKLESTWTMNNPNGHGLVIGAFNEAGENAFDGWISRFEIYNYHVTYADNSSGNGPFRASELTTAVAAGAQTVAEVEYKSDKEVLLASAPQTVTLNTEGGGTVSAKAVWTDAIFDGSEYYLLGKVDDDGFKANCLTVTAPVAAYVADLVCDGEYVGNLVCAADGQSEFVFPATLPFVGEGYDVAWYTDGALETAYAGGKVTENIKLYADVKAHVYQITYELNGGTNGAGNPSGFTVLDSAITLADPVREGYIFKGWYADSDFQTKITVISPARKSDIIVYANWEEKQNTQDPPQGGDDTKPGDDNTNQPDNAGCGSAVAFGAGAAIFLAGGCVLLIALLKRKARK